MSPGKNGIKKIFLKKQGTYQSITNQLDKNMTNLNSA